MILKNLSSFVEVSFDILYTILLVIFCDLKYYFPETWLQNLIGLSTFLLLFDKLSCVFILVQHTFRLALIYSNREIASYLKLNYGYL